MMPAIESSVEHRATGSHNRADAARGGAFVEPFGILRIVLFATMLVAGCGDESAKQQAVYQEAAQAAEREQAALKGIRTEAERVFGEYLLHNIEGRIIAGDYSPRREMGLLLGEDAYGNPKNLYGYLFRKMPLPWYWQIERLITDRSSSLPWYDRTQGEVYRRRVRDRYSQLLIDLRDRVSLQTERVKHAEDYARLLKPGEEK